MRIAWWIAIVSLTLPTAAFAEQFDATFFNNGRLVLNNSNIDYRAVTTLPLPNGQMVQVFEIPNTPGVCAGPACIGLFVRSADGTQILSRSKAAGLASVSAAALDSSGRIVVVGPTVAGATGRDFGIVRLKADLTDDPSFAGGATKAVDWSTRDDTPTAVAIDRQDRIVVVGSFSLSTTDTDFGVVRLRNDGALDTTFNSSGIRRIAFDLGPSLRLDQANAVAIGNDGRIMIGGIALDSAISRTRVALARLNPDGSYDTSFCAGGCSTNLGFSAISDGRTVYYFGDNTAHSDELYGIELLSNGSQLLVGTTYTISGSSRKGVISRLFSNGFYSAEVSDAGLGENLVFRSVRSVDASGTRIIVAGDSGPNQNYFHVQAFTSLLQPEANFGNCHANNSGFCFIIGTGLGDNGPDQATSLTVDAQGRALFMGHGVPMPGDKRYLLTARFTNTGGLKPDTIFRNGFQ